MTCYMISCNAAHVAAVTLVNARKQEGMTPAEGLGSQWGATIGSFGLHPPFNVALTAVHTWRSLTPFMWSSVVIISLVFHSPSVIHFLLLLLTSTDRGDTLRPRILWLLHDMTVDVIGLMLLW